MDQSDRVKVAGAEFWIERLRIDVFAPIYLERLGVFSATPADVEPFVGERAAHAIEDPTRNEIANGRFHYSPGR